MAWLQWKISILIYALKLIQSRIKNTIELFTLVIRDFDDVIEAKASWKVFEAQHYQQQEIVTSNKWYTRFWKFWIKTVQTETWSFQAILNNKSGQIILWIWMHKKKK